MKFLRRFVGHPASILAPLLVGVAIVSCASLQPDSERSQSNSEQDNAGPAVPSIAAGNPDTGRNQRQTNELWPQFQERLIDPVTWFTGILAFLAWRQWRVYQRQADLMCDGLTETRKAANAAKDNAATAAAGLEHSRLQQRAWLSLSQLFAEIPAMATHLRAEVRHGEINIVLKNYGLMPATNVRFRFFVGLATLDEEPTGEWSDIRAMADIVPGGEQIIPVNFDVPIKVTDHKLPFIRGRFDYQHGFGAGWTTFCGFYAGKPPLRMPGDYNQSA